MGRRGIAEADVLEVRIASEGPRERGTRRRGRTLTVLVILAAAGLILRWADAGPRPRAMSAVPAAAHAPGASGVAGAYGYPRECLSITIARAHPSYARADFDHRQPCGRYTGDTTAIFHRLHGVWRAVLDAAGYSCPVAGIPASVGEELGVCQARTYSPPASGL